MCVRINNMGTREPISIGEYYHVYNRGVDKRSIVNDQRDAERFLESIKNFNSIEPIGSLYLLNFNEKQPNNQLSGETAKLVEIVCYCVNPNHYHFLLKEIVEGGISEFMKRLGGGYTWYFNNKHKRSGALFQGVFRSVHIKSNEQLLHSSVYVSLNSKVHKISGETAGKVRSSWEEYMGKTNRNICKKGIILKQ